MNITRDEFDLLCESLYKKIETIVRETLADAEIEAKSIDQVLMIGGSSRIKKIEDLVQSLFPDKKLNNVMHRDHAIAYGAALRAAKYCEATCNDKTLPELVEAQPLMLGIGLYNQSVLCFIPKNSPLPIEKSISLVNSENDQKDTTFKVSCKIVQ